MPEVGADEDPVLEPLNSLRAPVEIAFVAVTDRNDVVTENTRFVSGVMIVEESIHGREEGEEDVSPVVCGSPPSEKTS